MQSLSNIISDTITLGVLKPEAPDFILSNLKAEFGKRPYQIEAFSRFIFYMNNEKLRKFPAQLLFHMATGSGKTLIMAGCILYLYTKGYRNFIFFVNSTNIIEKTLENFLNKNAGKYLFSKNITIGHKQIRIKEVNNFQAANQDDVNIVFSTIQGLHSRLNTPKENSITFDDFTDNKIVIISDEAHHINSDTKKKSKLNKKEIEENVSWEKTVNRVFNSNPENILLEFTATADLNDSEIAAKYFDKLIFDYPLKQFRIDGYSKEVKVLQADLPEMERALQAVLLSQYRRKVFEKNKILVKPVILFKSKTIKESNSFYEEFVKVIKNLKPSFINKIKERNNNHIIKKAIEYFDENHISIENLIAELKTDFDESKCITVNSENESEEKQIAVNTLEDEGNEFRAIFAVDKLNEGWDVLNLFDIVRLYDTKDSREGVPGKTTMSEAQLIGRGARYCPFKTGDTQALYNRKYDAEPENELRICEELYYHSAYNPRYIDELNSALEEIGIKGQENEKKSYGYTDKYNSSLINKNNTGEHESLNLLSLPDTLRNNSYKIFLKTGYSNISTVFIEQNNTAPEEMTKILFLRDLGTAIIRKAINKIEFFRFDNLIRYFPNLNSITEFITSDKYLGNIKFEITGEEEQINNMLPDAKLEIAIFLMTKISSELEKVKAE